MAQVPPPRPPTANPVPQGSPVPRILPPAPPASAPGSALPALPPPGAEVPNRTVRVSAVSVDGVTAFPAAEIARYTQGLTGPAVPLPKIDAARQAILQHYRSAGYVLSTVSANLDTAGKLRFVVTEGRIASVKLDGDIGPAGVQVLRFLNRLTKTRPIDSVTLERYLLLAQDVPGVTLRAVLQPSADDPGALNLIAEVSRRAVSGLATFDNRAFVQTGPIEGLGVVDFNSFTEFGEKTEFSYYHTFPNSQNFGQFAEEMFLGGSGLKMRLYAGTGEAIPTGGGTDALSAENYHGTTTVLGGVLSYPVIRSRQQTLNLYTSLDALESNVRTGPVLTTTSVDSLRVLRLGEDYAMSDLWLGADRPANNVVSVRLSQGLRLLGAETNGTAPDAARQNERSDFFKVNFEATRTQTLFPVGPSSSVALMGLLAGQWSDQILPPEEQFYLGGAQYTRGYYAGQIPGDKALVATAELQFNTGTNLSMWGLSADISTQFYLFYDWGETWQNRSTDFATVVNSAGGGVRLQVTRYTEVDFEALGRFNRYPTGSGANVSALNGIGLYWRVLGHF
ncbi:MAG TPA: ShlB/FhaC/HecB family hemolysin secretion/activation protein [Acetobacteraceae bacterium]|nr:ShlB/FhaC/HecB family hemolysin secretion/activation protein [Acetobacteraceae bacterium]